MSSLSNVLSRWRMIAGGSVLWLLSGCEGSVGPWNMPPTSDNDQKPGTESSDGEIDADAIERPEAGTSSSAVLVSTSSAPDPVCGNGEREADEECDNDDDANCVDCKLVPPALCGNGNVEAGEECDDGNDDPTDGCFECEIGWCGDGVVNGAEVCDDGNNVDTDGCDSNCRAVTCGDGALQENEECDPPSDTCSFSCRLVPSTCGNGKLESAKGEQCDDGNEEAGDSCFQCKHECGDGRVDRSIGETCEPGVAYLSCQSSNQAFCLSCAPGLACDARDACNAETCTHRPACGDGITQPEYGESCDPPGSRTCDSSCKVIPARCGNELVEGSEQCDPPDGIYCSAQCQHLQCGNGVVEGLEACDPPDGITCDDECRVIAACEASESPEVEDSNVLPGKGTFDESIVGWTAQSSVSASHVPNEGNVAPGALRVLSSGSVSENTSVDIRGVATCLPITPNVQYTFSAAYRFVDGTPSNAGASVSLHLYPTHNCRGTVVPSRGPRLGPTSTWSSYTQVLDTSLLGSASEGSVYLRLDVWRPTTVGSVEMVWDDLNLTPVGAVDPSPEPQGYCGDCLLQANESCDDGNRRGGDGCSDQCELEVCGNGVVDLGEQCDDGNLAYNDGCDGDCRTSDACRQCMFTGECVDEALAPGNGCYALLGEAASGIPLNQLCSELFECVRHTGCAGRTAASGSSFGGDTQGMENCYCGNTGEDCLTLGKPNGLCRVEVERALESKNPADILWRMSGADSRYPVFAAAQSLFTCTVAHLDSVTGSVVNRECGGVCSSQPQCGNGVREDRPRSFLTDFSPGLFEGTRNGTLTCDELTAGVSCYPEQSCGCFFEECDDNNTMDGDGCDANCFVETCGNGVLQAGEDCDDGNHTDGDGCDASCKSEWECGNGIVEGGEKCDDGNLANLDGCDALCELEVCGNGIVQPQLGEQCDPDVTGRCENCKLLQQDACTECVLQVDLFRVLATNPSKSFSATECFSGVALLDKSPYEADEGLSVGEYGMPNGLRCLTSPDCAAAWQCLVNSRCFLGAPSHECYCGAGTQVVECGTQTWEWASGECKEPLLNAFIAQFGRAPTNNQEFLQYWQDASGSNGYPLFSAATLGLTCLTSPTELDLALCDGEVSLPRRVECQNHCFGDQGLSESDVAANQCL